MDDLDYKIVNVLRSRGRISFAELATTLGLSSPSTAERVRRLEEKGVIKGYKALINEKAIGPHFIAFITISLDRPVYRSNLVEIVGAQKCILECYHIAGEGSYLLKADLRSIDELEHLVNNVLKEVPGVLKTVTTIVLATVKEEGFNVTT